MVSGSWILDLDLESGSCTAGFGFGFGATFSSDGNSSFLSPDLVVDDTDDR